jgi:hypothetical protein
MLRREIAGLRLRWDTSESGVRYRFSKILWICLLP